MKKNHIKFGIYGICVLILFFICMRISIIPHNYSMEAELCFPEGQFSDSYGEFLFFDGESWRATDDTTAISPVNRTLRIKLSQPVMEASVWRLDPINEECNVYIKKIVLKDNGVTVKTLENKTVLNGIAYAANISNMQIEDNGIFLEVESSDPYLEFSEEFTYTCKDILASTHICDFLIVFLPTVLVGYYIVFSGMMVRINEWIIKIAGNKKFQKLYPFLFTAGMILFAVFVYRDYLFGNKLYVFKDVGGDSYDQTFPYYMYRMRYYAQYGEFPTWSFQSGLGNHVGSGIWDSIIAIFGYDAAPAMLAVVQVVKLVLSGIFFYAYLKTMGMSNLNATIFSYCYAYCGHMTVRAAWSGYPGEVLAVAVLLWAFEQWFCRQRWYFLPLSVVWMFITNSNYFSLLYLGILCGYALYRYQTAERKFFSWKKCILIFAGVLLLGIGLTGANPINGLISTVRNPRVSGEAGMIQDTVKGGIHWFSDVETLAVMVVRSLAPNALDIDISEYQGISNYLTDPVFYCGIFALLLIPQLFHNRSRRETIWHGIALGFAVLYMVCPIFRNLLSGFTGDYQYRINSFWVIVVLLVLASQAFERIYRHKELFSRRLFWAGLLIWLVLGGTELYVYHSRVDNIHLYIALLFLLVYTCIMLAWQSWKQLAGVLVFAVTVGELYILSYDGINDRDVMLKTDMTGHSGYYDGTVDCMEYLHETDVEPFYRTAKEYYSVYLCDGLIQNYNGLTSYQGGISHSGYLLAFMDSVRGAAANMGISKDSSIASTNFILGFRDSGEITTMLSTKYILSKEGQVANYGYRRIADFEGINIFQNQYYIPFGYLYDTYLPYEEYQALNETEKRKIFLETCILPDDMKPIGLKKADGSEVVSSDKTQLEEVIRAEKEKADFYERIAFVPDMEEGRTLLLSFDVDSEKDITGIICYADGGRDPNGYMNIPIAIKAGEHHYLFELSYTGIDSIRLVADRDISGERAQIRNLCVSTVNSEEYYASYIENVRKLQQHTLEIESFMDNEIIGTIRAEQDSMLFFSIPYTTSWKAYVDGEETEWTNVNIGFSGIGIDAGEHRVILRYENNSSAGKWVKFLFMAVYAVSVIGTVMMHKKNLRVMCFVRRRYEKNV